MRVNVFSGICVARMAPLVITRGDGRGPPFFAILGMSKPIVNFINILCTNFLYGLRFGSFFYVHVTRENNVRTKNLLVKC